MNINFFVKTAEAQEVASVLIVLLAFGFFNRRSLETKLIGIFCACDTLTYIVLHLIVLHGKEINVPQGICGTFQFLVVTSLYYIALNKKYKNWMLFVAIAFLSFSIYNMFFWQRMDMNTYTSSLSSFIILVYCVVYWYRLMVDLPVQDLHRFPMFWYNSAFLIFGAGTLFLYLFTSYLAEVLHNDLLIYWSFHNILGIVQRIVIMIGLWQDLRNIKLGSSLPQVR